MANSLGLRQQPGPGRTSLTSRAKSHTPGLTAPPGDLTHSLAAIERGGRGKAPATQIDGPAHKYANVEWGTWKEKPNASALLLRVFGMIIGVCFTLDGKVAGSFSFTNNALVDYFLVADPHHDCRDRSTNGKHIVKLKVLTLKAGKSYSFDMRAVSFIIFAREEHAGAFVDSNLTVAYFNCSTLFQASTAKH